VIFDLLGIGIFGGFYIVPLYALIQSRSEPSHRARIIAGNNIVNAFLMVLSAALAIVVLSVFKRSISELFLATAILSAIVSIYIYSVVPEFFMRFLIWIFLSFFYNIKKTNTHHIPDEGGVY
jgi:MFS family permease